MRWIVPVLLLAGAAWAQDPAFLDHLEKRFDEYRQLHRATSQGLKPSESLFLDYGGVVTVSRLYADDIFGGTHELLQYDAKLHLHAELSGHEAYGRLRFRYRDFAGGDSYDGGGDDLTEPIGDRWWYRFDSKRHAQARRGEDPDVGVWAQIGRQQVDWASAIVLSQTLYAARFGVETRSFAASGLVGRTPEQTTVDFDASRPEFDTNTRRWFYGAFVECRAIDQHRPFVYCLIQQDENDQTDGAGRFWGYDSTYVGIGSRGQLNGRLSYQAEVIKEFGSGYTDFTRTVPQTIEDIDAWAGRFEISWMPVCLQRRGGRFEFEVLVATGDGDRIASSFNTFGNLSGTDDTQFNAFGFANTGLAMAPDLSNLVSVRFGASLFPAPDREILRRLRVGVDAFALLTFDADAPTSVFTDLSNSHVGWEFDLLLDWRILSDVSLEMRYGIFVPGGAFFESDPRHFIYVGFSYGF